MTVNVKSREFFRENLGDREAPVCWATMEDSRERRTGRVRKTATKLRREKEGVKGKTGVRFFHVIQSGFSIR